MLQCVLIGSLLFMVRSRDRHRLVLAWQFVLLPLSIEILISHALKITVRCDAISAGLLRCSCERRGWKCSDDTLTARPCMLYWLHRPWYWAYPEKRDQRLWLRHKGSSSNHFHIKSNLWKYGKF